MRMRVIRSLVFASVSVMSFFIILSTLTNSTPASPAALHTLVTHTHNHINHLQNNIKEEFESLVSSPDPEVLHKLGFVESPVLYPNTNWTNLTSPVIATAVSSSDLEDVANVLAVAAQVCPEANILIHTLDLSVKQTARVESLCNDTCIVVPFEHASYPSHVRNWRLKAYRPIIIQELLVRAGAVLWLDPSIRLVVHTPHTAGNSSDLGSESDSSGAHLSDSYAHSNRPNQFVKNRTKLKEISSAVGKDHREKSFVEFPDVSTNSSGLQAVYPNDQAALLNIANRYVPIEAETSYHSDLLVEDAELNDPGRNLLMVAADDALQQRQAVRSFSFSEDKNVADGKAEAQGSSNPKMHPDSIDLKDLSRHAQSLSQKAKQSVNNYSASIANLSEDKTFATSNRGSSSSVVQFVNRAQFGSAAADASGSLPHAQEIALHTAGQEAQTGHAQYLEPPFDATSGRDQTPDNTRLEEPSDSKAAFENIRLEESARENCVLKEWKRLALDHGGVLTWQFSDPLKGHLPTSALTHPGMFAAMHTIKDLYDFHKMSDAGAVLVYNTEEVHESLMKHWLGCSLVHHCLQPIGAQDTGCKYDKKPLFRYSGCHLYDTSAFNVALGLMLGPDHHPYQPDTSLAFTRVPPTPVPTADDEAAQYLSSHSELRTSYRRSHNFLRFWQAPVLPLSNRTISRPTLKSASARS